MGLCSATCSEVVPPEADEPTCAPSLCRYTYRSKSLSLLAHWIVMTTEPTCVSQKAGSRSMFKSKWSHRASTGSIAGGHSSGSEVAPAAYKCPCQEVLGPEVEMVPVPGSAARAAGIEENNMTSPSRMTKKTSPRCPRLAIGTVRSDMLPPIFVERHKRGSVNVNTRYSCGLGHSERRRAVSDRVDCSQAQMLSEAPPEQEWVRPDLNRSRQHPKLVGFLVGRDDPRAQTKLPHGPAAPSKDCGRKNASPAAHPNGSTSSMSSAWDRIIRRQQYRFRPSSSRTFLGSSPWRVRSTKLGKALPTTLPQVKHRTGMIMPSPIRLLSFLPRAPAERFLRQLPSRVGDDQRPVVFAEERFEFVVVQVLDEPAGDRRAHRVRLAHDPAALDVHIDVDRVDFLAGELEGLEDLQAAEFERVDLNRDAVDPDHAPPFRQGRAGHGGLPLPARHDRLHGEPSNLDPNSLEISPRLMYGPWGGRFATSTISRGLSLYASGKDK